MLELLDQYEQMLRSIVTSQNFTARHRTTQYINRAIIQEPALGIFIPKRMTMLEHISVYLALEGEPIKIKSFQYLGKFKFYVDHSDYSLASKLGLPYDVFKTLFYSEERTCLGQQFPSKNCLEDYWATFEKIKILHSKSLTT